MEDIEDSKLFEARRELRAWHWNDLLDPPTLAHYLGVKIETLAAWRSNRRYPLYYVKVGYRVRYRVRDVLKFIDERIVTVGNEEANP